MSACAAGAASSPATPAEARVATASRERNRMIRPFMWESSSGAGVSFAGPGCAAVCRSLSQLLVRVNDASRSHSSRHNPAAQPCSAAVADSVSSGRAAFARWVAQYAVAPALQARPGLRNGGDTLARMSLQAQIQRIHPDIAVLTLGMHLRGSAAQGCGHGDQPRGAQRRDGPLTTSHLDPTRQPATYIAASAAASSAWSVAYLVIPTIVNTFVKCAVRPQIATVCPALFASIST